MNKNFLKTFTILLADTDGFIDVYIHTYKQTRINGFGYRAHFRSYKYFFFLFFINI